MKTNFGLYLSLGAALLASTAAIAQETTRPAGTQLPAGSRLNRALKASDIIGLPVKNFHNEKLGKVVDLAIDIPSGRIVQVILSSGGVLGVHASLTAVPPEALHYDLINTALQLDISKERFAAAPEFDLVRWSELNQSNHVSETYSYFGQAPFWTQTDFSRTESAGGRRAMDKVHDGDAAPTLGDQVNQGLADVRRESKFVGAPVKDTLEQPLGRVENFVVDLAAGRILAVVVSSGGALGMGGELNAIPPSAFQCNPTRDSLILDASKQTIAGSPHFRPNQWPDFNQPDYDAAFYRAYQIQPYFASRTPAEADNTGQNLRDRNGNNVTPLSQGNSQSDINTTASIRRELVDAGGLSLDAENVKIITLDGHVTLRGAVRSAEEKQRVEEIASGVADARNVDSQLQVTQNPNTSMSN